MTDINGNLIEVGDTLKSEWDYDVTVYLHEDGYLQGKLVCKDDHPCKDIPYDLNNGKGYTIIKKGMENENNKNQI